MDLNTRLSSPEDVFIDDLLDDIDEILSLIAYAGYHEDFDYIIRSQEYIKEKYGPYIEQLRGDPYELAPFAYDTLMDLLLHDVTPDVVLEEAENFVQENLVIRFDQQFDPEDPFFAYLKEHHGDVVDLYE